MNCGSGGSKSRLAKAAGAEPSGQMRDEKLHAVVARSTFRSQIVQNTSASDHFWKLRCRKSARRCGAKHIRVAGARDCRSCGKWAKREGFVAFSTTTTTTVQYTTLQLQLHLHYITLHYIPLHYIQVHSITLNYTTLHYTALCYTALHYTTLHSTTLH